MAAFCRLPGRLPHWLPLSTETRAVGLRSTSTKEAIMIGLKELALVAVVVLVLYGRTGVVKSRQFQTILPWISPLRRPRGNMGTGNSPRARSANTSAAAVLPRPKPFLLRGNRLFWFLTILAATAVAAWIVTRVLIVSNS
jgi:hypothetical protein